ncbi:hypothetical protein Dimus_005118, partial [Dionaea muscipula]
MVPVNDSMVSVDKPMVLEPVELVIVIIDDDADADLVPAPELMNIDVDVDVGVGVDLIGDHYEENIFSSDSDASIRACRQDLNNWYWVEIPGSWCQAYLEPSRDALTASVGQISSRTDTPEQTSFGQIFESNSKQPTPF